MVSGLPATYCDIFIFQYGVYHDGKLCATCAHPLANNFCMRQRLVPSKNPLGMEGVFAVPPWLLNLYMKQIK
jgi:hypothetical protein